MMIYKNLIIINHYQPGLFQFAGLSCARCGVKCGSTRCWPGWPLPFDGFFFAHAYLDSCRRLLRTSPDQMADALKLHGSQLSTCSVILDDWTVGQVGQSSWTLDMRHYFFRDSLPVFQEFMHESRHLRQFEFVFACIDS